MTTIDLTKEEVMTRLHKMAEKSVKIREAYGTETELPNEDFITLTRALAYLQV